MKFDKREIYYVYEWIRLDTNEPFYTGKGKGDRWKYPERNNYFNNIVNKVGLNNIAVSFLHEGLDEKTAFDYEVYYIYIYDFIYEYGMTNIHVGGRGGDTYTGRTEEEKKKTSKKISESLKGRTYTEESKKKMSESQWLKGKGPESHPMYGVSLVVSEETRKKISENSVFSKPVVIFKNGEEIGTFSSITNAAEALEKTIGGNLRNGISMMVNKDWNPKSGRLKGYDVMFKEDYEKWKENPSKINEYLLEKARIAAEERIKNRKNHKGKAVVIFKNGEYLNTFISFSDAKRTLEREIGGGFGDGIGKMVNDNWVPKRGRLKGYSAMYLSDYEKLQEDQLKIS